MFRLLHSRGGSSGRRRLWLGAATTLAFLGAAAPAQAAPFVYVTNLGQDQRIRYISQYDIGAGGLLAPLFPPAVAGDFVPIGVSVSPDGRSVYATGCNDVCQFDVGPDGTLSRKSAADAPAGDNPYGVAVSPDGKSVYITNLLGHNISQYDVGPAGLLFAKSPATVAAGDTPFDVAVSPDGQSVYAANYGGTGSGRSGVSQYDVGPGGKLSPKRPPLVEDIGPIALAVSPDGQSVYVVTYHNAPTVSQYDVAPDGTLSPKSPPTVAGGGFESSDVAVSPDGKSAYVVNPDDLRPYGRGDVSQYDVGPGGKLSPKRPATVVAGFEPRALAVSPDGKSVYVVNYDSNNVSQYDVGLGGALSPKGPATVVAGQHPYGVAVSQAPTSEEQCKRGGWREFGFKNQGRCIRFVKRGSRK
jgi:DNA-binding beta-propeller fold protein YncE